MKKVANYAGKAEIAKRTTRVNRAVASGNTQVPIAPVAYVETKNLAKMSASNTKNTKKLLGEDK